MTDKCNIIPVGSPFDITKMHGHMTITLTDVNTGEVEIHEDDNMMTNALQEYFRNLGLVNYPNINQNDMVISLLGGIMGFDEEISESASILHVPAGHKMIFNGCVGVINNGNPTEMGSYSGTESGWQQDGSFVQTYDFSTSQANGTISCVCLTSRNYGFFGEGNSTSLSRHSSSVDIFNLIGSTVNYNVAGLIFKVDYTNSFIWSFNVEEVEVEQNGETVTTYVGKVRKYRLPITKVDLRGTTSEPILIQTTTVTFDDEFMTAITTVSGMMRQPYNGTLICWNTSEYGNRVWGSGDWVQYVWTITSNGTISRQTITNTYGEDLYGLQAAHFDGNYCFFVSIGGGAIDSTVIYVLNRTTGAISAIQNPGGIRLTGSIGSWQSGMNRFGWDIVHRSGDGRIVTCGDVQFVVDAVKMEAYPCNKQSALHYHYPLDPNKLVWIDISGHSLIRDATYIATINNLETPVVKTAEKTMKVVYKITFDN